MTMEVYQQVELDRFEVVRLQHVGQSTLHRVVGFGNYDPVAKNADYPMDNIDYCSLLNYYV